MRFSDIPRFPSHNWQVDVDLYDLQYHVKRWMENYGLNLDPDFQRAHVWTQEQRSAYIEYVLRGGEVGKVIVINAPGFDAGIAKVAEVVDGKQRLMSLLMFLRGMVPAFGHYFSEYEGRPGSHVSIKWRVVELDRKGVLDFYLSLNSGGTPHTSEELEKVRKLRAQED